MYPKLPFFLSSHAYRDPTVPTTQYNGLCHDSVTSHLEQYDFFWCGSGKFHYFLVWVRQVPLLSLSLSVYFSLPDSLRLTPSFLSLGLNPESAPGIREDLVFLRAREAGAREDLKFKV